MRNLSPQKWMELIPDSTPICKIKIPGTHNSGAGPNTAKSISKMINFAAQCHGLDIKEQINQGIRYVDVRLKLDNECLNIYHGMIKYNSSFSKVLQDISNFLRENPSEAIFMRIHREDSDIKARRKNISDEQFMSNLVNYLRQYENIIYTNENPNPTLGEVRGKFMIFDMRHVENPQAYSPYKIYKMVKQSEYKLKSTRQGIQNKVSCVKEGMSESIRQDGELFVNEVNSVGSVPVMSFIPSPKRMAEIMNNEVEKLLMNRIPFQGVLMFDFPEISNSGRLIEMVYEQNFT
ncbi:1-phosphatidylinositol phosphodiesterase [Tritrichomonas foetus]|uniref:1-phosphatidylinositol phosphodiesterase n=1 Tax=Tritrichomonas foetus TaxID=1144522 RepID=A0A1J4KM87_9EUKA|nr:1-phosphatidylinositol phosphodiesterase [Tritrichomonas foetus]|eukprot:OHT10806.1 1-phosphatidylinositol phosphodiesterase [Tritrichomonas foetus]